MPGFCRRKRRRSGGQVLLLAVLAMIILVIAVMVLFDVQRIIRGKIRVMSGIDAAALTGAEWQKHTLNIIGELNLVKACTVLISDSIYGIGGDPAKYMKVDVPANATEAEIAAAIEKAREELRKLKTAADMLTEMQVRVSFVGPLIGFGAAQQAAKNNGLPHNRNCNEYLIDFYNLIMDDDIYGNPDIVPQTYHNYAWRYPYANMIFALAGSLDPDTATGAAVGTMVKHMGMPNLYADPPTKPNFIAYLQLRAVMDAIAANDWCMLKTLIDADDSAFLGKWWGNIKINPNRDFLGCSEILPIHADYSEADQIFDFANGPGYLADAVSRKSGRDALLVPLSDHYNKIDPVSGNGSTLNPADEDLKFNPLPAITWAIFADKWQTYADTSEWKQYLRSGFREGYDYYSGALSYFSVSVPNNSFLTRYNLPSGFRKAGGATGGTVWGRMRSYSDKASRDISGNMTRQGIRFMATAKPFGVLKTQDGKTHRPFDAGMILPVFNQAALIPVALEIPDGAEMEDRAWIIYLTKFLPALGEVDSLDKVKNVMKKEHYAIVDNAGYIGLIRKLQDPAWRAIGRAWLDAEATGHDVYDDTGKFVEHVIDSRNRDHCFDWKSGSGGYRRGPTSLH
ncbi:MAG: hypothetical protein E7055_11180 [Lentisphaerae bacterium]|nr:hypothetical protein [Lentisphaerota bacterium]